MLKNNHHINVSFLPYNPPTHSNIGIVILITAFLGLLSVNLLKFKKKIYR